MLGRVGGMEGCAVLPAKRTGGGSYRRGAIARFRQLHISGRHFSAMN